MLGKWENFRQFDEDDLADIEDFLKKDEKHICATLAEQGESFFYFKEN